MDEDWCIHTAEYYSAVTKKKKKGKEIMPFAVTWMDLETLMLK